MTPNLTERVSNGTDLAPDRTKPVPNGTELTFDSPVAIVEVLAQHQSILSGSSSKSPDSSQAAQLIDHVQW